MSTISEFVKMSDKGQLVVPQEIRASLNLNPGETFVAFPVEDGILFKKVEMPDLEAEFNKLSKEIRAKFRKNKVVKKDIKEAIKWARKG